MNQERKDDQITHWHYFSTCIFNIIILEFESYEAIYVGFLFGTETHVCVKES